MALIDLDARLEALDITRSFIVQAPAGSGKTEMLTQRFLKLLATVNTPEQIVALTFTRKAAFEMRERIIEALEKAHLNVTPTSPHQAQTLTFAKAALNQSEKHHWQLLENPNRLKIMTLDALCQQLSQAIWLKDSPIAYANITENPELHFESAAIQTIQDAIKQPQYHKSIRTLLLHVDNRQNTLVTLFMALLRERDQWLTPLFMVKGQQQSHLEDALLHIERHELKKLNESLSSDTLNDILSLCQTLANLLPNDSHKKPFLNWKPGDAIDRHLAKALGDLLLTQSGELRKSFDHHVGLKKDMCEPAVFQQLKKQSQDMFFQLTHNVTTHPPTTSCGLSAGSIADASFLDPADKPRGVGVGEFIAALRLTQYLPSPHYSTNQWAVLQALFELLPLLVSQLYYIFQQEGVVDFSFMAGQALAALGTEDCPTDLTLYLDNVITHLLIDEFQDTSLQQYELINRLTAGWQYNDGKTLFVVGDPMQSIYRFRQAEVGLFLQAKHQGIGQVKLQSLQLSSNFRSYAPIVNWINEQFIHIFPTTEDIEKGGIPYHSAQLVHEESTGFGVHALSFEDKKAQASVLCELILEKQLQCPDETIAILVRARSQLKDITKILRENQINYLGVDITLLSNLPHIRAVWSLTKALLMPTERLPWLEFLRSELGGLSLEEIYHVATLDMKAPILQNLRQAHTMPRAQFLAQVLTHALTKRQTQSLVEWINDTLTQLHRQACFTPSEEADLMPFWTLLGKHEQLGLLPNIANVEKALNALYAQSQSSANVQVMTIHKSKGLEFDTVILPSLSTKKQTPETKLLRFLALPTTDNAPLFLLSPLKAAHEESCLLYDYLTQIETEKDDYEASRLLYVATTRAKKHLYLLDHQEKISENSFRALLKTQPFTHIISEAKEYQADIIPLIRQRLPLSYYEILPEYPAPSNPPLTLESHPLLPKIVGTALHALLEQLSLAAVKTMPSDAYIEFTLKQNGLALDDINMAKAMIKTWLSPFLETNIGQWILKTHENAASECEVLLSHLGRLTTRIIDRTFIDNGVRWIIDYKTGQDSEDKMSQHQMQVNEYAKYWSAIEDYPISCGIYYFHTGKWVSWQLSHSREGDVV